MLVGMWYYNLNSSKYSGLMHERVLKKLPDIDDIVIDLLWQNTVLKFFFFFLYLQLCKKYVCTLQEAPMYRIYSVSTKW